MIERKYKHENLEKFYPVTVGKFDIPLIHPTYDIDCTDFIGFNYAKGCKDKKDKAVHFFIDDYQFTRVWTSPDVYAKRLKDFKCVLSPDFSLYTDFPVAMQIYNHYRKHWLAQYWQSFGITVIPTICWSDEKSFDWCFDGEPVGSVVAVSAIGTQKSKETKEAFKLGYDAMCERLKPTAIIFYGDIPDGCKGNIIHIKSFTDKWKKAKIDDFN